MHTHIMRHIIYFEYCTQYSCITISIAQSIAHSAYETLSPKVVRRDAVTISDSALVKTHVAHKIKAYLSWAISH